MNKKDFDNGECYEERRSEKQLPNYFDCIDGDSEEQPEPFADDTPAATPGRADTNKSKP